MIKSQNTSLRRNNAGIEKVAKGRHSFLRFFALSPAAAQTKLLLRSHRRFQLFQQLGHSFPRIFGRFVFERDEALVIRVAQ
jgi:hypothetical protein